MTEIPLDLDELVFEYPKCFIAIIFYKFDVVKYSSIQDQVEVNTYSIQYQIDVSAAATRMRMIKSSEELQVNISEAIDPQFELYCIISFSIILLNVNFHYWVMQLSGV